jgi:hypothetical protein
MAGRAADLQIGHSLTSDAPISHERPLPWLDKAASASRVDRLLAAAGKTTLSVHELDAALDDSSTTWVEKMAAKLIASWQGKIRR